jgi:hypothetical protein
MQWPLWRQMDMLKRSQDAAYEDRDTRRLKARLTTEIQKELCVV